MFVKSFSVRYFSYSFMQRGLEGSPKVAERTEAFHSLRKALSFMVIKLCCSSLDFASKGTLSSTYILALTWL